MTQFPHHDDDKLVKLLKQYRPLPPPASANCEEHLLELTRREPLCLPKQPSFLIWLLFSTIAAALLVIFGSYRWFNAAPKIATSDEELEMFLVDSWNGTLGEPMPVSQIENSENSWSILTEPEKKAYSYYYP